MREVDHFWARLAILAIAISGSTMAIAQTAATGAVVGTITDQSGASIPAAQIVLKDEGTGASRTTTTNDAGQYIFTSLPPGTYSLTVTKAGFREGTVSAFTVAVAKSSLLDVKLQIGEAAERVNVTAEYAADLQTVDSTVGSVVDSHSLINLPTVTRRANELIYLQVGAQPWANGGENGSSGTVAGGRVDQNQFLLDGLDVSDLQVGGACCGNFSTGIPIPVEALEEFRAGVANYNASFGRTMGSAFSMTTRAGTRTYHGAGYWYHQDDNLSANSWARNRLGQPNAPLNDNRYGFRLGGPLLGSAWKEKLFFFVNLERRRFPQSSDVLRTVPSDSLRQGILRFRDGTGSVVSYDLKTSRLCGAAGGQPCDPRGLGLSPVIAQQFALLPQGNDTSVGDGLNTIGIRGPTKTDIANDNALARVDFLLTPNWRMSGLWDWAQTRSADTIQIDIRGGANNIKTLATIPNDPRLYNFSLTGTMGPTLVNEFRVGYFQSTIVFNRLPPQTLLPAAGTAVSLSGIDSPYDIGSAARPQVGISRTPQVLDNVTWTKGKHILQGGFNFQFPWFYHSRLEKSGVVVYPQTVVGAGSNVVIPGTLRPPTCSIPSQANCILPADLSNWNAYYADALGIVDNVNMFVARDQKGNPLPPQQIVNSGRWEALGFYISDTWRLTHALTLSLGLNFSVEYPFSEEQGRRAFLIQQSDRKIIYTNDYLSTKAAAARQGQIYNPGFAYAPLSLYPGVGEIPNQYSPAPRLAVAWNPSFKDGVFGSILGDRKTVIRSGWGMSFARLNAVGIVQYPMIGSALLGQPSITNGPKNAQGDFYRLGVDGAAPIAPVAPTIPIPYAPAIPFGNGTDLGFDPDMKLGYVHSVDLTIQRELPGSMVLEIGYLGRFGRRLSLTANLNAAPFFIKDMSGKSSQTFAQAFDALATQLRSGVTAANVAPQPFFENNIGPGGTATLAAKDPVNIINGVVANFWLNTLDPLLPAPVNNRQIRSTITQTYGGLNNYNAVFVQIDKRYSQGLTLTANYTFSRNLGTGDAGQDNAGAGGCFNPYNVGYCYTAMQSDRKHGLNTHGVYELPFGKGHRWGAASGWDRVTGGWSISSVVTWFSGLPLAVTAGGQPFGASGNESAPLIRDPKAGSSRNQNNAGANNVGTGANPAKGGTGLNLFQTPDYVFNSFRRFLLASDTGSTRGIIRGLPRFSCDASLAKRTRINERMNASFTADFLNLFNHPLFNNPGLSLDNAANFGVISSQPGNPGQGDFWNARRIQLGLRFEF